MTLIAKPFITICGDGAWCDQIEKYCIPNLPMEPTEWVRKTGSDHKLVHVDVDARRFNDCNLMDFGNTILDSPLFHLFVIVENEDLYTKMDKDVFSKWIGALRIRSIESWKLFIIPDDGQKNKFAFNRFSIYNRMKSDFNIQKIDDYCVKISENPKERFGQLQSVLRDIILKIYDERCYLNEDKIRIQRETRFTLQWNYFDYFSLQEELADIYECLSLYEESLAQFDETNFIFVKCLDGYYKGEVSPWINHLKEVPFDTIGCLILTNYSDPQKRSDLSKGKLCLADFRAYLLSRQCALLQLLNKYQEIPALVYTVLIEFLNECKLLNLNINSSIKNSWIFLTSLQALQRFSRPIDSNSAVAQDYAALFLLALNSVNKLAEDWHIWVNKSIDWTPITQLIEKLSILNDDEYGDTPSSRLAGGLRSQNHFQEFHIKLYEEALLILKHIGRIRSANLLGTQLADLYCQIDKFEDAEPFYLKAIKFLRNENWTHLAMPLRLKLALCQKDQFIKDPEKYLKTCIHLAGKTFFDNESYFNSYLSLKNYNEHQTYYNELKRCVNDIQIPNVFKLEPLFSIKNIKLLLPDDGYQVIELIIMSHLPESLEAKIVITGEKFNELDFTESENVQCGSIGTYNFDEKVDEFPAQYSIPLNEKSSPQIYRTNKPTNVEYEKKELLCQSSMDENIQTLDAGVVVRINSNNNDENDEDDTLLTLICFPKADAGLRARKASISRDIVFSNFNTDIMNLKDSNDQTQFISHNSIVSINPGENSFVLKSKEFGLFFPKDIKITLFNDNLQLKDEINKSKIDQSFSNMEMLETLVPSFLLEHTETVGFINSDNKINTKLKMGLLTMVNNDINVELCVKNEHCKESFNSQKIVRDNIELSTMRYGNEVSLTGPLHYNLDSKNDRIYLRIPGLIRKEIKIDCFEEIDIVERLIPTALNKYIVKIELQKHIRNKRSPVDYVIKSSSLKLHHSLDLCQLLPLVHKSLSTGIFNEQMNFTLLWFMEINDITNFEKELLKFTLSLDVMIDLKDQGFLLGSVRHEFQLNY